MNDHNTENPVAEIKAIQKLHIVLIVGQAAFAAVAAFMVFTQPDEFVPNDLDKILKYLVPVVFIIGISVGIFFFNMKIKQAVAKPDLMEKLKVYKTALLLRDVIWEFPTLLALVTVLVTYKVYFLGYAIAGILLFLFNIPSKSKIAATLQLDPEQQRQVTG